MSLKPSRNDRLDELQEHVRRSRTVTPELLTELIAKVCIRFAACGSADKARVHRLVEHCAWTDAALALLELDLPHWELRRLLYDDGEWHCFLSRRPAFPLELERNGGDPRSPRVSHPRRVHSGPKRDSEHSGAAGQGSTARYAMLRQLCLIP